MQRDPGLPFPPAALRLLLRSSPASYAPDSLRLSTFDCLLVQIPVKFAPFFSYSYEPLFPYPLSFDILTNCRGGIPPPPKSIRSQSPNSNFINGITPLGLPVPIAPECHLFPSWRYNPATTALWHSHSWLCGGSRDA
jgi:hypothetical protein